MSSSSPRTPNNTSKTSTRFCTASVKSELPWTWKSAHGSPMKSSTLDTLSAQGNCTCRAEIPPDLPPPTDVAVAAFEHLWNALLCPPVLALPKANRKLVVDVEACADQVRCTPLQEEPGELLHPVGHWSEESLLQRKTTPPRSANASASCGLSSSWGTSSPDNGSSSERITKL